MVDITTAPWGILVLRLALGALFLAHGLRKLLVSKPAGVQGYFRSQPVYVLRENGSTQEATARWLLKSVRIESGRIVAVLSPI